MISFQGSKTGGSPHVGRKFEGPHIGQNHMPTAALLHEAKLGEALLLTLSLHLSLTKLFALAMFPQFQPSHWFVSYNFLVWKLEFARKSYVTNMLKQKGIIFAKVTLIIPKGLLIHMRPQMYLIDKHL